MRSKPSILRVGVLRKSNHCSKELMCISWWCVRVPCPSHTLPHRWPPQRHEFSHSSAPQWENTCLLVYSQARGAKGCGHQTGQMRAGLSLCGLVELSSTRTSFTKLLHARCGTFLSALAIDRRALASNMFAVVHVHPVASLFTFSTPTEVHTNGDIVKVK